MKFLGIYILEIIHQIHRHIPYVQVFKLKIVFKCLRPLFQKEIHEIKFQTFHLLRMTIHRVKYNTFKLLNLNYLKFFHKTLNLNYLKFLVHDTISFFSIKLLKVLESTFKSACPTYRYKYIYKKLYY